MATADLIATAPIDAETLFWASAAKAPRLRTMERFAAEEIVLPSGPYQGQRFRLDRQPFARLWFRAIDSGHWRRRVITGPSQSGKTTIGSAIPCCYHLFETCDWVVYGVPDLDMVRDKWESDLLPVIERTRYRELLPRTGGGSRGGGVKAIQFRNGARLRFMTAGGRDKSRAGFPGRVLIVTEADGFISSEASLEADKIKQLEARLRSHGSRKIVYLECTVTVEAGRIWTEYQTGTCSRIALPCPHCRVHVTPEREHLHGWEDAESVQEARANASFACPACGQAWTEDDRRRANLAGVLVHRGQEITDDGQIVGPEPATDALGFRWSGVNNLFATAGDLGVDEWNGARARDRDNAERELRQFVWCMPYEPPEVDLTPLDPAELVKRTDGLKRGVLPVGCVGVTVGVDTGKRALNWVAIAWLANGGGRVVDYGEQTVEADRLGIKAALIKALGELASYFAKGWQSAGDGPPRGPDQVWIDSGWHEHTDPVYQFCLAWNQEHRLPLGRERYRPSKGYGDGERFAAHYQAPKALNQEVRFVGKEFHLARLKRAKQFLVHVNADHWKSELHQRLAMPAGEPLAIVLFEAADKRDHEGLVDELTAEEQKEILDPQGRPVVKWVRVRRRNHKLDAAYSATAAGEFWLTVRAKQRPAGNKPPPGRMAFEAPDGRTFCVLERT